MKPIIEVKGLSKRYKLGVFNAKTLREEAEAFLARFGRKKAELAGGGSQLAVNSSQVTRHSSLSSAPADEFWALRDVSFDVQPGEVIGVIGRNGAGKSTLLKILSRITEPTSGEARIRGRVASLLEVGTGFHPELTGRENIFLNGAILGMTKAEIRSKFDEIVAFAEIEKFIDTPVKRYSSGMYVRLAFAVAAHLEPEILIVDEVLAVGDADFQKKCLGKMREVSSGDGRTVVFVSHHMPSVRSLCSRTLWMASGKVREDGNSADVIAKYLEEGVEVIHSSDLTKVSHREGNGDVQFVSLQCKDSKGGLGFSIRSGEDCTLSATMRNRTNRVYPGCSLSLDLYDEFGNRLLLCRSDLIKARIDVRGESCTVETKIPQLPLAPGRYRISLYLGKDGGEFYDYVENAGVLVVGEGDFFGTGNPGHSSLCRLLHQFEMSVLPN
jgi:lipopolysaccharide transport system ATP-binding protein